MPTLLTKSLPVIVLRRKEYFEISSEREIDWLALAIVGKIFAFEFITHSTGGKEGRIKYARNSWLRASKRIYLDVQSSFWCRDASAALHFCELQRENAHTSDSGVANDVSCNKAGEMAEKTTVTTGIVGAACYKDLNG